MESEGENKSDSTQKNTDCAAGDCGDFENRNERNLCLECTEQFSLTVGAVWSVSEAVAE